MPFGQYLLLDRVNIGGMAEVWRGKTFGTNGFEKLVAIKRILPNIAEDDEFISMFIDEAKITVQLTHANIAQIHELGHIQSTYFISMEYIAGKDLRAIFERCRRKGEPAPVPLICYVVAKLCEGLDYAHRKKDSQGRDMNIVHRDVSPQNVLISYEGEVKVIDFGIAKAVGKATKTQAGILKGKFGYMSPEQIRGVPVDRRSDIFAVGVCLYELLTGERLFVGESDFSVLEKVRLAEVTPPSTYNHKVPPALEAIVLKALAKDLEQRYQYASELASDLQRFLITSDEVFSRKDLSAYMKSTFAEDVEREKQKLAEYGDVKPTEEMLAAQAGVMSASLPTATTDEIGGATHTVTAQQSPPRKSNPGVPADYVPQPGGVGVEDPEPATVAMMPPPDLIPPTRRMTSQARVAEPPASPRDRRTEDDTASGSTSGPTRTRESGPRRRSESNTPSVLESATAPEISPVRRLRYLPPFLLGKTLNELWFYGLGLVGLLLVLNIVLMVLFLRPPPQGYLQVNLPRELAGKNVRLNIDGTYLVEGKDFDVVRMPAVKRLFEGPARVVVAADGYEETHVDVNVKSGTAPTVISPEMKAKSVQKAKLTVMVQPAEAELRVNGNVLTADPSGAFWSELPLEQEATLEARKAGYETQEKKVTPRVADEPVRVSLVLKPAEYALRVMSTPSGAVITSGGKSPLGVTPATLKVPANLTEVVLTKRCFDPVTLPVRLPSDPKESTLVNGSLRKKPGCR